MIKILYTILLLLFNMGIQFLILYQSKNINPVPKDIAIFFLKVSPIIIAINIGVGIVINKFYKMADNMFFIALLNLATVVLATVFSTCIVTKKLPTIKEFIGIIIIIIGVFIVNFKK